MRRLPVFTFVVLLVLAAGAPYAAGAATQEQVTLTVSVVNQSGYGVSGVTINATWDGGSTSETTASNGRAFVDVPRGADVELTIDDGRYVRNLPRAVEDASNQDVTIDVALPGQVAVTASDQDGRVANATVELINSDNRLVDEGTTSAQGVFTTQEVERKSYILVLEKPGYLVNRTSIDMNSDSVRRSVEMRLESVQITFRVLDDHFDEPRPVGEATVRIPGVGTQNTTSDGSRSSSGPTPTTA